MTKRIFLWYWSQRHLHFFCKFRMTFTWPQNAKQISYRDPDFLVIVRNEITVMGVSVASRCFLQTVLVFLKTSCFSLWTVSSAWPATLFVYLLFVYSCHSLHPQSVSLYCSLYLSDLPPINFFFTVLLLLITCQAAVVINSFFFCCLVSEQALLVWEYVAMTCFFQTLQSGLPLQSFCHVVAPSLM